MAQDDQATPALAMPGGDAAGPREGAAFSVVRWVLLVPGCALAVGLALVVLSLAGSLLLVPLGIRPGSSWFQLYVNAIAPACAACIFICVGTKIAPSYRTVTCYVLASLVILLAAAGFLSAILTFRGWGFVFSASLVWGTAAGTYFMHESELG